ncbi:protein FAR1-RELATED SEQUENCE 5-like [Lotus japonicus]|uniref:protein FAR1-RELATED SEQUENCE 5-like n=1 Tax=Lotus japonicus TaxID=34305 RepID=UPI002584B9B1|nr:protein FAR1-RELATED SEQUENCE 5-like [Lotus japonicus]
MENESEEGRSMGVGNEELEGVEHVQTELSAEDTIVTHEDADIEDLQDILGSDEDGIYVEEPRELDDLDESYYGNSEYSLDGNNPVHSSMLESDENNVDDEGQQSQEGSEELIPIDCKEDYMQLDFYSVGPSEFKNFHFANVEVAYEFYHWYGRNNGFSACRGTIRRNTKGEPVQQTFLCHRQGFREDRGIPDEMRMRQRKTDSRCGCQAKFRVHIDTISQRWYVSCIDDGHNHDLVPKQHGGILAGHRKMSEADIMSMNSFMKCSISAPEIFNSFATQAGGYEKVGFGTKNMLNQLAKQRRACYSYGKNAIEYLRWLGLNDPLMFQGHTENAEHGLENLFWCDGISRMNYKVFGDVLAFDATYKKNKYRRHVVIFYGVDHHNRTIIFASASVERNGANLCLVITTVAIPDFLKRFKSCMLSDYGIGEFKRRWAAMVKELELHDHPWVSEMYDKREMWATTYFRGKFFAGFRTSSRCEGFHSQLLKFVRLRYNLSDFVQHFHRCLCYMRFKELEADFASGYGVTVLQTNFRSLERSESTLLTKEVFNLFVPVISLASEMIVTEFRRPTGDARYKVVQYTKECKAWNVYYEPTTGDFRCSCEKFETYGLPCEHILGVFVFLHITELPNSLVSKRWTKGAKDGFNFTAVDGGMLWDSELIARYVCLVESCRELCTLASKTAEDFNNVKGKIATEKQLLKDKGVTEEDGDIGSTSNGLGGLTNGGPVRRPRLRTTSSASGLTTKRTIRCSACRVAGHNRLTCPLLRDMDINIDNESDDMDEDMDEADVNLSTEHEDVEYEGIDHVMTFVM